MNKVTLLLTFIFISTFCIGQKSDWKTAEKHFHKFEYTAAADAYEKVILHDSSNIKALEQISLCYTKLNNPAKAENWLSKVCDNPNAAPQFYKMYAQALASNGKYKESSHWYEKYNAVSPESSKHISNVAHTMNTFYADSALYHVTVMSINSKDADFSPAFYKDEIVFCSARENKNKTKFGWDNSHYIDLYRTQQYNQEVISFGSPINSSLHEGPVVFSKNCDTIYFTRNNYINNQKKTSTEDVVKLKIFMSVWKDGKWSKEQSISINNDEYSVGHPALSDDFTLYFVSDMPGGYGGTDLYFTKLENGTWRKPTNLGPSINTPENEMFPFIDHDDNLYFASSGYAGLGGLDIFRAKVTEGKFSDPKNIGYPINSSRDDFGFIVNAGKGYFSSNRGANPQDDNIYAFTIDYTKPVRILAVDAAGELLENFTILISPDTLAREVEKVYTYRLNCNENYIIQCSKNGYIKTQINLTSEDLKQFTGVHDINIKLERSIKNIKINLQSITGAILTGGTIEIKNIYTGVSKRMQVDTNGSILTTAIPGERYQITGYHPLYKNKTIELDSTESLSGDNIILIVLQKPEALFEKNEIGQIIELDIKYDLNKSKIRNDAALELDKLISFLKKNITIKIELGSHTDSRGSNDANIILSQKRAESAVRYIVSKGISSKRLIPIGYGEDDLKIKNASSEEEHQLNRRTTVKIVGI